MSNDTLSVEEIISEAGELASLPDIYQRLEDCINSPESTLDQISQIISSDLGLATRILKLSNSVLFAYPKKIDSIYTALSVIGTQQLRELVLATVVLDMFAGIRSDALSMSDFWKHSIGCGIAARVLATYRREVNVERFYLMGLFHDIGRLLLFTTQPKVVVKLLDRPKNQGKLFHEREEIELGITHSAIGAELLLKWGLPPIQQEAVRYHHHPQRAPAETIAVAIVHVADWLANAMQLGCSGETNIPKIDVQAWTALAIPKSALPTIVAYIDEQYKEAVSLFLKEKV